MEGKSLSQKSTFRNINQDLLKGVLAFVFCLSWSHELFPFPAQMPPITVYPNNSFSTMCMSYQASRCCQRSCDPHTNLRMVIPPAWRVLPAVGSPQWGQQAHGHSENQTQEVNITLKRFLNEAWGLSILSILEYPNCVSKAFEADGGLGAFQVNLLVQVIVTPYGHWADSSFF